MQVATSKLMMTCERRVGIDACHADKGSKNLSWRMAEPVLSYSLGLIFAPGVPTLDAGRKLYSDWRNYEQAARSG